MNYLSQTSTFSLIEVSLRVAPLALEVDPGPEMSLQVGESGRFRASFIPPEGIEHFRFTWDFGDGARIESSGSTPRADGVHLTATVTHAYKDDRDSPFIVTVDVTGTGPEGSAEGSASMEVVVQEVPVIDLFAGEDRTVEEGSDVDYTARFTRPAELWDFQYQWEFGDGSPTLEGEIEGGESRISVAHKFADYRQRPYVVRVTVTAMSEVGEVSASDTFNVHVTEVRGFAVGGWDVGETAKSAVRALTAVGQVLLQALIWIAIFSWAIALGGVAIYLVRWRRRARKRQAAETE